METILFFPRSLKNGRMDHPLAQQLPGWHVQSVGPDLSPAAARELIAFWRPAACIVNDDRLPASLFRGIPTTFLHRNPANLPEHADYVMYDEREIGRLAAQELLALDLPSYAYVADRGSEFWNVKRQHAFVQAMTLNGRGVAVFTPSAVGGLARLQTGLASWLKDLPRPVGIFAACDDMAELVCATCLHAGLAIPTDVALLGVDNNESICEACRPSLSSIAIDLNQGRLPYLEKLRLHIANPNLPRQVTLIQPSGVVRRASTRRFRKADAAVLAACETIRTRACCGLTAREVVDAFPCKRRMAELRFRAATGQSILEAIRAERRATAERLLRDGQLTSDLVAAQCGYSTPSSVYRLLHA